MLQARQTACSPDIGTLVKLGKISHGAIADAIATIRQALTSDVSIEGQSDTAHACSSRASPEFAKSNESDTALFGAVNRGSTAAGPGAEIMWTRDQEMDDAGFSGAVERRDFDECVFSGAFACAAG